MEFIDAQCKENNVNKHDFTLDKKYCLQEKLLLSKKCGICKIVKTYYTLQVFNR